MPVRVGAEREEMTEKLVAIAMGGMLMLLTLMTLGFGA
jgi:hypothetical protein